MTFLDLSSLITFRFRSGVPVNPILWGSTQVRIGAEWFTTLTDVTGVNNLPAQNVWTWTYYEECHLSQLYHGAPNLTVLVEWLAAGPWYPFIAATTTTKTAYLGCW